MGLFGEKVDDGTLKTLGNYISGLDEMFREKELVDIIWDGNQDKVIFQSRFMDRNKEKHTANLPVGKIKIAKFVSEKEIIEQQKSVGGRAVVGGLLLGPLGAIVGGMSGVGNKQKTKRTNYIIFNYDEDKVITFEVMFITPDIVKVLDAINQYSKKPTEINL